MKPVANAREPLGPVALPTTARVLVKICGVTRAEQAVACLNAGADRLGLNFHPASPRCVSLAQAAALAEAVGDPGRLVGVFVDRPATEVRSVAASLGLGAVQLHGAEPPEYYGELGSITIIRAYRLRDESSLHALRADVAAAERLGRAPDCILVDAFDPARVGGTGRLIEDLLLEQLPSHPRLILAGGLTPENVAERARRCGPWMVDVAGGVETRPGDKDMTRVEAFLRAAHDVPAR